MPETVVVITNATDNFAYAGASVQLACTMLRDLKPFERARTADRLLTSTPRVGSEPRPGRGPYTSIPKPSADSTTTTAQHILGTRALGSSWQLFAALCSSWQLMTAPGSFWEL